MTRIVDEGNRILDSLDAERKRLNKIARLDSLFDDIVHHARVIERYDNPMFKPLPKHDFLIMDNSRRQLAALRKVVLSFEL